MRAQLKNQSDFLVYGENISQAVLEALPRTTINTEQSIGTTISPWSSHTDKGLEPGSGIVPGMTAAALFIGFVLAVYALLWKCMASPPRRKRKMKKVMVRNQSSLIC